MSEEQATYTPEQHARELAGLQEAQNLLEMQTARYERQFLESLLGSGDYDTDDWDIVYDQKQPGLSEIISLITLSELKKWRDRSRDMYYSGSSHIRRVIRNSMNYAIGSGMTYSAAIAKKEDGQRRSDEDIRALGNEIDEYFRAWAKRNNWTNKQREIVERGKTDGETYLRFLTRDNDLKPSFLNPEDIRDPEPNTLWPLGVQFAKGFVEDVIFYAWTPDQSASEVREWIPAGEVTRWFFLGSPSTIRGIPPLIPALKRVRQYEGWLGDRILLNKVRARVAVVKSYAAASPTQIEAMQKAQASGTTIDPKSGKTISHQQIKAGSIVHTGANIEWKYLTPNVQANDVRHDGRQILLDLAASVGQPEFAVTMDASNANFASTMVAEAPGIKEWEAEQSICMIGFEEVWQRVITHGIMNHDLPQPPGADFENHISGYEVMIQGPQLVSRDRLADTKADQILVLSDVMSKTTMAQRAGLDPDLERDQMELEAGEEIDLPAHDGTNGGSTDGDDSDEDGQTEGPDGSTDR